MLGIYTHMRFKSGYVQCIEVYLNRAKEKEVIIQGVGQGPAALHLSHLFLQEPAP